MRTITLILAAALLTACAQEVAVLRIMDYGGAIPSITGRGCAVHQSGSAEAFARVRVTYSGANCFVEVLSDVQD